MKRSRLRRRIHLRAKATSLARGGALERTPLAPINRARAERRRAEAFGVQAARCRELPCLACLRPGPSDPAHVRSRGAGGKDRDVIPLCRPCHRYQHDHGWAALRLKYPRMVDPAAAAAAGGWLERDTGG